MFKLTTIQSIGIVLTIALNALAPCAENAVVESSTEANGVQSFKLRSDDQPDPQLVRVFADEAARAARPLRILYVLPVEPREERRYGDGFEEARKLQLKGWIVVAPSFAQLPWYADHPSDPKKQLEHYFIKTVVPFIDAQFPGDVRQRCLVGFSKSGWGAFSLLLRYPEIFAAASAWDAPLMKDKPDQFGMQELFVTQENFERYHVAALLKERAAMLQERQRLHLSGYGNFLKHAQDAHALLDELKIPHLYQDGPKRVHVWGSGWLADSVRALETLTQTK